MMKQNPLVDEVYLELFDLFGGSLNLTQIGRFIGARSERTVKRWVEPLTPYIVDAKCVKYRARDVARLYVEGRADDL